MESFFADFQEHDHIWYEDVGRIDDRGAMLHCSIRCILALPVSSTLYMRAMNPHQYWKSMKAISLACEFRMLYFPELYRAPPLPSL